MNGLLLILAMLLSNSPCEENVYININNNEVVINESYLEPIQDNTKKYKIICAAGTTITSALIAGAITLIVHYNK